MVLCNFWQRWENFYKKKNDFTDNELKNFIDENVDQLKIEYIDFNYVVLNPKNLLGIDEFNQAFFDKIDQIEIDIANGIQLQSIAENLDIKPITKTNIRFSGNLSQIEKKIFELRNNDFDIFESGDDFILYKKKDIDNKRPDLNDDQTKKEIIELIFQKKKFEYNRLLLDKISNKKFKNEDFLKMGQNVIETIQLNSIKDNKKFEINAVELLYTLPVNSFTLINDDKDNIYLTKIKKFNDKAVDYVNMPSEYINKQNSELKNNMLKSFDSYLSNKYEVNVNQKTLERVKNYFQ